MPTELPPKRFFNVATDSTFELETTSQDTQYFLHGKFVDDSDTVEWEHDDLNKTTAQKSLTTSDPKQVTWDCQFTGDSTVRVEARIVSGGSVTDSESHTVPGANGDVVSWPISIFMQS